MDISNRKSGKSFKIFFIWTVIILAIFFSKRMDITPAILIDAGTKTFLEITLTNILSFHKLYVILMMVGAFAISYFHNKLQIKKHSLGLCLFAFLLSLFHLIGVTYENSMTGMLLYNISKPLLLSNVSLLLGYFFLYLMVIEVLYMWMDRHYGKEHQSGSENEICHVRHDGCKVGNPFINNVIKHPNNKYTWFFIGLFMFLCWLPYILICYPGTIGA